MSSKCPRCSKTVYFAERQTAEGADWHGLCLRLTLKERKENAPKHMFCIQDHANLNPDKMRPAAGETKFCSECGAERVDGDKFCSGCGSAL
eukprot:TRINITY_DN151_c0_g1_i1.p1 TRINITY_DN151_c0_g1~~TRINITY_DN151_c0_g1_i1.p1  ORF type:complete len:103 (+),score=38.48 TRINITY_DN151_c0_g1_i1:39-311(+)